MRPSGEGITQASCEIRKIARQAYVGLGQDQG